MNWRFRGLVCLLMAMSARASNPPPDVCALTKSTELSYDEKMKGVLESMAHQTGQALTLARKHALHKDGMTPQARARQLGEVKRRLEACAQTYSAKGGYCELDERPLSNVRGFAAIGHLTVQTGLTMALLNQAAAPFNLPFGVVFAATIGVGLPGSVLTSAICMNAWMSPLTDAESRKYLEKYYYPILRNEYHLVVPEDPKLAHAWFKMQSQSLFPVNPLTLEDPREIQRLLTEVRKEIGELRVHAIESDQRVFDKALQQLETAASKISLERRPKKSAIRADLLDALRDALAIRAQAHKIAEHMNVPEEKLLSAYSHAMERLAVHPSFKLVPTENSAKVREALIREGEWEHLNQYLFQFEEKYGPFSMKLDVRELVPSGQFVKSGVSSIDILLMPHKYAEHQISIPFTAKNSSLKQSDWVGPVSDAVHHEIEKLPHLELARLKFPRLAKARQFEGSQSTQYRTSGCLQFSDLMRPGFKIKLENVKEELRR